jgi:hypothetical protein
VQTAHYISGTQDSVSLYKNGIVFSPGFEGYVTYTSQEDHGGLPNSSAQYSGTWTIAGRRFVGDLHISRYNGQVSVVDNRVEQ